MNNLPKNFNWKLYLDIYSDLRKNGISTKEDAENHYLSHGIKEGRIYHIDNILTELPENFDWRIYNLLNPDIAKIFPSKEESEKHYKIFGHKEGRKFSSIFTYEKLISYRQNQYLKLSDDNHYTVFINHQSSLTGAPIFLQDLANLTAKHSKSLIFIDSFPNAYYNLNPNIIKYYHFDDSYLLKNILDSVFSINLIYANSLNTMLKKLEIFDNYLYKTIFHFHECQEEILNTISYKTLLDIIQKSHKTVFTAKQILDDCSIDDLSKIYTCAEFIGENRTHKILSEIKIKKRQNQKPIICMCGTNCHRKNPNLFIEIAKLNPDYDFLWIGGNILKQEMKNLICIPEASNPFEYFNRIDYFLLTSIRDPCPIVVLENLLMNNKVILLDNNIKYKHDISKLENVYIIKKHNNCPKKITKQLQKINLNTIPNCTNKNQSYILNNFAFAPQYHFEGKQKRHYNLCISYFHKNDKDINYYIDIINNKLMLEDDLKNVFLSISGLDDIKKFTDNIVKSDKVKISSRENKGFDLGGLIDILTTHKINNDEYITYIHNKTNIIWREELYKILYCADYFKYDTTISKTYYTKCKNDDLNRNIMLKHEFMRHLYNKKFNYISGTCFNTKVSNLKSFIDNIQYIKDNLTSLDTNDSFWQKCMRDEKLFSKYYHNHKDSILFTHIDKDSRNILLSTNSKNFFELQQKHNSTGIPDLMFEHALERYLGFLISNNKNINLI